MEMLRVQRDEHTERYRSCRGNNERTEGLLKDGKHRYTQGRKGFSLNLVLGSIGIYRVLTSSLRYVWDKIVRESHFNSWRRKLKKSFPLSVQ